MDFFSGLKNAATGRTYRLNQLLAANLEQALQRSRSRDVHALVSSLGMAAATVSTKVLEELIFGSWNVENPFSSRQRELTPERTRACLCVLTAYYVRRVLYEQPNGLALLPTLRLTEEALVGQVIACLGGSQDDMAFATACWNDCLGDFQQYTLRLFRYLSMAAFGEGVAEESRKLTAAFLSEPEELEALGVKGSGAGSLQISIALGSVVVRMIEYVYATWARLEAGRPRYNTFHVTMSTPPSVKG